VRLCKRLEGICSGTPPLLRGTGSIGDLLGPGGGTGVDRGLQRTAAARTDGTAAYDVLSELQGL